MKPVALTVMLILSALLFLSCSGNSNPVLPPEGTYTSQDIVPISESPTIDSINPNRGVFGAWKIHIDPETMTAEIIPSRNAHAIGDIFDSDLSQFLTVNPCSNCLMISRVWLDIYIPEYLGVFDSVNVEFQMKHPFGNIIARPDLHGFDVRLIFISEGHYSEYNDIQVMRPGGTTEGASINRNFLINADGLTSHYDELANDERYFINNEDIPGNLNPFLRFFEDSNTPDFDPHAPVGNNVIPVGSGLDSRIAYFNFFDAFDGIDFYAVADVAYGQSAVYTNRPNPQYYLPAFHRTEAWRTEYWIENNNLTATNPLSNADIVVQVFDWQHGATVDTAYPDPANLSGIPAASNVSQLELSVPALQDDLIVVMAPESGSGSPTDPLQYRITVTNENLWGYNTSGLLAVRDGLYGQASPNGRLPVPETATGFPYETLDILDYTHYYPISINMRISSINYGYNNELLVVKEFLFANNGDTQLLASFFMDFFGKKFQYAWDFDYDGFTFDVNGTGLPMSPLINCTTPGKRDVGLRVTTNSVPPREYIYSIPVYCEGRWHDETSNTSQLNTTYYSRNHALAMTDDNYYMVYTSKLGGSREVWLAVGDINEGPQTTYNITEGAFSDCYNPSIRVIDDGTHDGVYIAFTYWDAGEPDIYSIEGNLDGTGFEWANRKVISDQPETENNVCLLHDDNALFAYYVCYSPVTGNDIRVSQWDFSGNWLYQGLVNNVTVGDQNFPSAVLHDGEVYCVWHDARYLSSRGYDIYMASTNTMTNFSDSVNISTSASLVEELYPSISVNDNQMGVAYLQIDAIDGCKAHLAIIDIYNGSILDHQIQYMDSKEHTIPAVSTACDGMFTVVYGAWDSASEALTAITLEVANSDGWAVDETVLFTYSAGTIPIGAANIFPGVINRPITLGQESKVYGVENFIAYRTFINGDTESTSPFPMRFGEIQTIGYYSDSNETYQ